MIQDQLGQAADAGDVVADAFCDQHSTTIVDYSNIVMSFRPIDSTLAWLSGYRRLTICYERQGEHFAAFLQLTAALTFFKKLAK